ncbi:MAG: class I SAM-dependent methyltransferase [Candidatus Krumholzibacteriia bacterium]
MAKITTDAENTLPARFADRHILYQWSVQVPDFEVSFMARQFKKLRGRPARRMREDFCGTACLSAAWVRAHKRNEALGLDLDRDTIDWGLLHNVAPLGKAAARVHLYEADVRNVTEPLADVACAYNFSWFLIHPYPELVAYFSAVRRSLAADGLFFMDCYGGWEAQQVMEEPRLIETPEGNFTYTWEQASYDPINNIACCHIHFELHGKRMRKAFTYEWRLYSLAEARDALLAAGFSDVRIFWDHSSDPEVDHYRQATRVENQPGWLAYIVGVV